ncbi:OmpP1/FadL family transporter [Alistipes sp.]|uniref:OmpP1/FadL family transporter n=1 Tax=Alistipes sp. TaxID=1872444 RepID=UPI003A8ADDD0
MPVKNTLIKLLVAVAALLPVAASAQTSSINAFSPYTMYGIGEVNTPGTLVMRSMGGVGVAMRSTGVVNLLNPAGFSAAPQKTFLFNFGLEGQNYYNSQKIAGEAKSTVYNTFNFHDIAFQMPVAKRLGLGFSLTPYSSVGYRTKYYHEYDPTNPVIGNVGNIQYNYQGDGDITEVKLGLGWEVFKNFSVGVAAQYYWGSIKRSFVMTPTAITGEGTYASSVGSDVYDVSSIKGQVGVQWSPILNLQRILTVGAAFDFGGDLNPEVTKNLYVGDLYNTVVKGDTTHLKLVLPYQLAVGAYYQTSKWAVGVDYVYQNWGGRNTGYEMTGTTGMGEDRTAYRVEYVNTSTIKVGVEYTPNRYDIRNVLKRWSYRAGFRYGSYNQSFNGERLGQWAVTAGFGIPVKLWAVSSVDVGVEYGRRGYNVAERLGLVRQQYFKISVGFTLFAGQENGEYWFMRPKYD